MKKFGERAKAFFTKEGMSSNGIFALFVAAAVVVNVLLFVIVQAFGLYLYEKPSDNFEISGNTDHIFESARTDGKK